MARSFSDDNALRYVLPVLWWRHIFYIMLYVPSRSAVPARVVADGLSTHGINAGGGEVCYPDGLICFFTMQFFMELNGLLCADLLTRPHLHDYRHLLSNVDINIVITEMAAGRWLSHLLQPCR